MVVSVVIPALNAESTLPKCLAALARQTRAPDEVIVVDDGSQDGTALVAAAAGVRVVKLAERGGPARARNRGVEAAKGDLILFTDADCEPTDRWVEAMLAPFARDPEVAAARGAYRTRQRSLVARFVQAEYESRYARMASRETIDFVDTYSAAYRREAFERVGGFDEAFPTACVEDQELSFRLAAAGAKMVFAPDAVVFHRHADALRAYCRKKEKIAFWKTRVLRRHRAKAAGDAHTPPTLALEAGLVALAVLCAVAQVALRMLGSGLATVDLRGAGLPVAGIAGLGALLAAAALGAAPIWAVLRPGRDWPVALVAPVLVVCRACSFLSGIAQGFLFLRPPGAPVRGRQPQETSA